MAIVHGYAAGVVVFLEPDAPSVVVVHRAELRRAYIEREMGAPYLRLAGAFPDAWVNAGDEETARRMYAAIVAHDADVIWTKSDRGWTCCPDVC